ncbi:MAG: hypothetical protein ACRDTH_15850, partial [Pseudonocardiaceae bacterium]
TPLPEPGWGDPYVKTPAYQTPDGPVWLFRKGTRARFYDRTGRQVGPEQANVGPAVAYAHSQGWVTEWGKAPAKAKLPKVTPEQVSATGERARSPRARKSFLADAALDDLEMEKRALFAAREEIPLSPTSGLPLTPGERDHRSKLKAYEEQIDKAIQRAKGDAEPPANEAAQRRQVMVTRLRDAGDGQNAVLTALRGVDTSGHPQMATALQVAMSTLTHPSAKSVTAQADELVRLSRGDADAPGDEELRMIADQIDAVAAALDTAGSGTRVPLRSVTPSERPRLADYLRDYTAALRTRLGEQDTEAPEQEKPAAKPKAGRKPKKLSERLTAAVDRYNARAGEGRPGTVAKPEPTKPSGRLRSTMADYEATNDWDRPPAGQPGAVSAAKPEINLSRLGGLDDAALSTALDDARRKHRMLVENGVPRNSTALHDAKRAMTMLEDEQRGRQERSAGPAAATGPDRQARADRALERARTDIGAIKPGDDDLTRADIDAKRGEIEQAQYDMVEALRHNAVSNWSTPSSS